MFPVVLQLASENARCDYGVYVGASADNAHTLPVIGGKAAGLKMYLNETFTSLKLNDITVWMKVCSLNIPLKIIKNAGLLKT